MSPNSNEWLSLSSESRRVLGASFSAPKLDRNGSGTSVSVHRDWEAAPRSDGAAPARAPSCFHTCGKCCRRRRNAAAASKGSGIREHGGAPGRGHRVTRVQRRSRKAPAVEEGRADGSRGRRGLRIGGSSSNRFFRRRRRRRRCAADSPSCSGIDPAVVLLFEQVYLRSLGPGSGDERREPAATAERPALGSRSSHFGGKRGVSPTPLFRSTSSRIETKVERASKNFFFSFQLLFYWFTRAQNAREKRLRTLPSLCLLKTIGPE